MNEKLPYLEGQKNLLHEKFLSSDNDSAVIFAKRWGAKNTKTQNAIIKNGALKIKNEKLFTEVLKLGLITEKENRLDFSIHSPIFLEKQFASLIDKGGWRNSLMNAHRLNITHTNLPNKEYDEIKELIGINYSNLLHPKIISLWGSERSSDPTWKDLEQGRQFLGDDAYSIAYFVKFTHVASSIADEDLKKLDKITIRKGLENFLKLQEAEVLYGVKSFASQNNVQGSFVVLEILSSLREKESSFLDADLGDFVDLIDDFNKRNPIVRDQNPLFEKEDSLEVCLVKTAITLSGSVGTMELRKMFLSHIAEKSPQDLEKLKKYVPDTNVYLKDYIEALSLNHSLLKEITSKVESKDSSKLPLERSFKL